MQKRPDVLGDRTSPCDSKELWNNLSVLQKKLVVASGFAVVITLILGGFMPRDYQRSHNPHHSSAIKFSPFGDHRR